MIICTLRNKTKAFYVSFQLPLVSWSHIDWTCRAEWHWKLQNDILQLANMTQSAESSIWNKGRAYIYYKIRNRKPFFHNRADMSRSHSQKRLQAYPTKVLNRYKNCKLQIVQFMFTARIKTLNISIPGHSKLICNTDFHLHPTGEAVDWNNYRDTQHYKLSTKVAHICMKKIYFLVTCPRTKPDRTILYNLYQINHGAAKSSVRETTFVLYIIKLLLCLGTTLRFMLATSASWSSSMSNSMEIFLKMFTIMLCWCKTACNPQ